MNKTASTKVITGKVRFSYTNVFKPAAMEGQEPKYSCSILISKSDRDTLEKIKQAIEAAKAEGIAKFGGKIPANLKNPLRDGDLERLDSEAYRGHYFINATSKNKPGIIDANRNEIIDTTEFYSGCYGRASLNFYAFSTAGNKGIACGLNNLQKLADGEFLGGRSRAEDDFNDDFDNEDLLA